MVLSCFDVIPVNFSSLELLYLPGTWSIISEQPATVSGSRAGNSFIWRTIAVVQVDFTL